MELLLELLPDPELGYEGTGTGGAGEDTGQHAGTVPVPPPAWPGQPIGSRRAAPSAPSTNCRRPPGGPRHRQGQPQLLARQLCASPRRGLGAPRHSGDSHFFTVALASRKG